MLPPLCYHRIGALSGARSAWRSLKTPAQSLPSVRDHSVCRLQALNFPWNDPVVFFDTYRLNPARKLCMDCDFYLFFCTMDLTWWNTCYAPGCHEESVYSLLHGGHLGLHFWKLLFRKVAIWINWNVCLCGHMSVIMGDPKTVLEGSVKYRDKKKVNNSRFNNWTILKFYIYIKKTYCFYKNIHNSI